MPRSSCSRAGPFIAPDRATGEEGLASQVRLGALRGVGGFFFFFAVRSCTTQSRRGGGEGRKEDGERGDDSPFPSGLSASGEERTHNKYG